LGSFYTHIHSQNRAVGGVYTVLRYQSCTKFTHLDFRVFGGLIALTKCGQMEVLTRKEKN